ncbi:MAG: FHA domain-containing protein, partial [Planctomycetota bacterium]
MAMADLVIRYEAPFGGCRKFWLREGDSVTVGASAWADRSIEFDASLAPIHYALEVRNFQAKVRALDSDSATFRNGHRIEESVILDGDRLRAGHTVFLTELSPRCSAAANQSRSVTASSSAEALGVPVAQPNGLSRLLIQEEAAIVLVFRKLHHSLNCGLLIESTDWRWLPDAWTDRGFKFGTMCYLPLEDDRDTIALEALRGKSCTLLATRAEPDVIRHRLNSNLLLRTQSNVLQSQLTKSPSVYINTLLTDIDMVACQTDDSAGATLFITA